LVRSAQAGRPAPRDRLLGWCAGAPTDANHPHVSRAEVALETSTGRQPDALLLNQRDARATSRLVSRGLGAAPRPVGNSRDTAARRGAALLRLFLPRTTAH